MYSHFRSRDKDAGRTIRSAVSENPMLHANFTTLCFIEPGILPIEVLHCGIRDFRLFCACYDCDLDLDPMTFTYELDPYSLETYGMCDRGIDLAGILGVRMASAEGGSLPSGIGYVWGRVSYPQPTRRPEERRELVQWGLSRASTGNGFWRILKATERSFLYPYDKIWGTICISLTTPNSGDLPLVPRDLRQWCAKINFLRQGFRKLSLLQTYIGLQRDRHDRNYIT